MDIPIGDIDARCAALRRAQATLARSMSQQDVVGAVATWAARWKQPRSAWWRAAEGLSEPFPFAMTRVSLEALLDSLTPDALWALIDAEHVRDAYGFPLIGHVIAGNTPLLAWVSGLRAVLMRSASFVKLPSGGAADWGRLFVRTLAETSPLLAPCIHLAQWPGGTAELDAALCRGVDLVLAYGGQSTLQSLQALCPSSAEFHGYGHRVSFGLVTAGAASDAVARGFARDVLLYDQGGCLSPHTIFVQGPQAAVLKFAAQLADALQEVARQAPPSPRAPHVAARVQQARLLARMEAGTVLWEDPDLRWTVIARDERLFAGSPTHGVVSVQPLDGPQGLAAAVAPCAGHLQGCAIALTSLVGSDDAWRPRLERLGVSRVCRPGELQAPPLSWRQDGKDVLRGLLPAPSQ